MSARQDIARLLEEWRRLSQAEGGAIESAAWTAVKKIQSAKTDLQRSLAIAREKWTVENPRAGDSAMHFRAELGRLISLEVRNAELMAAQLGRARQKRETIAQAWRNLRKIERSYVFPRTATAWNCYS